MFLLANNSTDMYVFCFIAHDHPPPSGSASLAQVHRAVLHSGKEVAVKVQHSTVQGHSKVDTVTIEFLAK